MKKVDASEIFSLIVGFILVFLFNTTALLVFLPICSVLRLFSNKYAKPNKMIKEWFYCTFKYRECVYLI